MKHQSTLPSESIGLDPNNIDSRNMEERVYQYIAQKKASTGESQAPVPRGTVDKAGTLRKHILQLSLAPDIYMNSRLQPKGTACLG